MALINNTTLDPKVTNEFFTNALLTGNSLSLFKLIADVKGPITAGSVNWDNLLQGRDCAWTPSGDVTLGQKIMNTTKLKVNTTWCDENFMQDYRAHLVKSGVENNGPDDLMANFLYSTMQDKINAQVELLFWQGDTASLTPALTPMDGILKKLAADATVVDIITGAAITPANIISQLQAIFLAIPDNVVMKKDYIVCISPKAWKAFMASTGVNYPLYPTQDLAGLKTLVYLGMTLVVCPGMEPDSMVALSTENAVVLTDLLGDVTDFKVLDMNLIDGTSNTRIKAAFDLGVDFYLGAEIVYSRVA